MDRFWIPPCLHRESQLKNWHFAHLKTLLQHRRLGCTTPVCPTDCALTPRHDSETLQTLGRACLHLWFWKKTERKSRKRLVTSVWLVACLPSVFTFLLPTRLQDETVDHRGLFVLLEQPTHSTTPVGADDMRSGCFHISKCCELWMTF